MLENTQITNQFYDSGELFRQRLVRELEKRARANAAYSLRAFSKTLDLNPGCLSALLNGRRKFTTKMIVRVGQLLGFDPQEISYFTVPQKQSSSFDWSLYDQDTFTLLEEWYHDAILELAKTKDFKPDLKWVARRINLPLFLVRSSVERMCRLGLMQIDQEGRWEVLKKNTNLFVNDKTSKALKKYQASILEKSQAALAEDPIDRRYHSSFTLAIDASDIPRLKEVLRDFRHQFHEQAQKNKTELNQIYNLQISFFALTEVDNHEK